MQTQQTQTTTNNTYAGDRLLRCRDVLQIVCFSRSYLYALIQDERFPKPIRLDHKSSRWVASEVAAWVSDAAARFPRGTGIARGASIGGAK